jgi:alkylation response protein AidB-like acyl-CoA dehydrogenase
MNRRVIGSAFACAMALTAVVAAQNPPQNPPQNPTQPASTQTAAAEKPAGMVVVEGCVVKEVDAPGRRPPEEMRSQAERDDDYVLTATKMITGASPSAAAASQPGDTPVGTSGAAAAPLMFEIEGLEVSELRPYIGKRVQIEGTFENIENARNPLSFANELVDLRGISIKPAAGDCPAK